MVDENLVGDTFDNLIIKINEGINKYANLFNIESDSLEKLIKYDISILFERTLSNESNNIIKKYFENRYNEKFKIAVSELKITLSNLNGDLVKQLRKTVNINSDKSDNQVHFYIDGYFKIDDLIYQGVNYLFVEYKLDNKFIYTKLAEDYLKFKKYTCKDNKNTIFMYIIFGKDEQNVSILNNNLNYQILSNEISKNKLRDASVFIYLSNDDIRKKNNNIDNVLTEYNNLNNMIEKIEKIFQNTYTNDELLLLEVLPKFNSNVIFAWAIKSNYNYLVELWNATLNKFKNDKYLSDFLSSTINEKVKIIKATGGYKYYQEKFFMDDGLVNAFKEGYHASKFSSFYILLLLEYFNKEFIKCNTHPIWPKNTKINNQEINYSNIAKEKINKFKNSYKTREKKENIKNMIVILLYFIFNIYNIAFTIDVDSHKVLKESNKFIVFKELDKIQVSLNKITRLLGIEQVDVNSETILDDLRKMTYTVTNKY